MIRVPQTTLEELIVAIFGVQPEPDGITFLGYPASEMTREELLTALIAVTRFYSKQLTNKDPLAAAL